MRIELIIKFLIAFFSSFTVAPILALYRWITYCRTPPSKDRYFSNELVLVTGGAQGIGRLIAENFALTTATVIIWDVNEQQLNKTVSEMKRAGMGVHGYVVDVSDLDQLLTGYQRVQEEVGEVTVLVNNAGIVIGKNFLDMSIEEFELIMSVNLTSQIHLTRAVLPFMQEHNHGYVINISSITSYSGFAKLSAYAASKAGVRAFTESLQSEFYIMGKRGVFFTCVCPYKIDTGMFTGAGLKYNYLFPALQPKYVADRVYFAARNHEFRVIIPWLMHILVALIYMLPRRSRKLMFDFFEMNKTMDRWVGHVKKD